MRVGGQRHAPAALPREKDRISTVEEVEWALLMVWMGVENLAPTGIQSPGHPAHSESPYRLQCPGSNHTYYLCKICILSPSTPDEMDLQVLLRMGNPFNGLTLAAREITDCQGLE
jgi:hypothetical protein